LTQLLLADLPAGLANDAQLYQLARAHMSGGEVVSSVCNESVPERGTVPGGAIRRVP